MDSRSLFKPGTCFAGMTVNGVFGSSMPVPGDNRGKQESRNCETIFKEFNSLYDLLHIAGYYHGLLYNARVVKDTLKTTEWFVRKVSNGY
ncbi:hypothetical protein MBAV_005324 [Candidatus Magnetobacterium bavaricum]|uniref:DUF5618 domain-containing protein n=1 Tax=Candidatus Magnetobacterium bavaricum TaxID=29290 RepID=A0A0F3GP78_9BACT|nr:hypothetical protein MBAV_005324 [Candidatus Magnetobacterium bavaricum]